MTGINQFFTEHSFIIKAPSMDIKYNYPDLKKNTKFGNNTFISEYFDWHLFFLMHEKKLLKLNHF